MDFRTGDAADTVAAKDGAAELEPGFRLQDGRADEETFRSDGARYMVIRDERVAGRASLWLFRRTSAR